MYRTVILLLSAIAIAGMVFCAIFLLPEESEKAILGAYRDFAGLLKEKRSGFKGFRKTESFLRKTGGAYHLWKKITPEGFLLLRIMCALAGLLLLAGIRLFVGLAGGVFFFYFPVMLLIRANRRDNDKMLPDLSMIYHSLEIQIRAGVFLTDALVEMHDFVESRRLKDALFELAGDIVLKADVAESMERFEKKFDNRYVDSLCVILLQALESGQALDLLKDIGEQLKTMQELILRRKRASLDRKMTIVQLLVLTVALGVAIFLCINYMFGKIKTIS